MTTFLSIAMAALLLLLCAVREDTTGARTPAELWAALRRAGWVRCTLATLRVLAVLVLLMFAAAFQIVGQAAHLAMVTVSLLAVGVEILGTPDRPVVRA